MAKEKSMLEKMMELFFKLPKVVKSFEYSRIGFKVYDNNSIAYLLDGKVITKFFSKGSVKDGRIIDTRTAKIKKMNVSEADNLYAITILYEENSLSLSQVFEIKKNVCYFKASITIKDLMNDVTSSNYLAPLDFAYPDKECNPLFLSLDQKMMLVPYDNDMWVRYESTPLRPGRTSYELTSIYNEETNEGLIIGSIDYDNFKNAIICSRQDARCYTAFSGVADSGTHDVVPHGYVSGKSVRSSHFICGWYQDIRKGLMEFGGVSMEGKFAFKWNGSSPFGWNSYSAGCMTLEEWKEAGDYLYNNVPNFSDKDKVTYINLDANFMLNEKKMKKIVDELHARGQKVGNYMAPMGAIEMMSMIWPLKGFKGYSYKDIIMKDKEGNLYPKIDSSKPVDITHPAAEANVRETIKHIVELGFDYLKIDFTAHASVEGERYDKTCTTGRQALMRFYKIIEEELDPKKIGRDIFVDLSIAPLFPGGYGHARRSCCDAFGHHEDVRYVLNALNYGFWQSGSLYCYNDPDHTVLYKSQVDGREASDYYSAKSRYNASLISGTVMLLSDKFGPFGKEDEIKEARERVLKIANDNELNEVGRIGKPFIPVCIKSDTTNIYFLVDNGKHYVAIFNFENKKQTISIDASKVDCMNEGSIYNLNTKEKYPYIGLIKVNLEAYDSAILEVI